MMVAGKELNPIKSYDEGEKGKIEILFGKTNNTKRERFWPGRFYLC